MSQSQEFFEATFGEGEGMAVIALLDEKLNPVRQKFFHWPEQADQLLEYVSEHTNEDVYTSPTLFKSPHAQRGTAKFTQVVYGDADTCPIDTLAIEPSYVVHTSPDKTHVYWIIEDCNTPAEIEALAHSVSVKHPKKDTGFDNGWAINKLLRVPSTTNTKYKVPYEVNLEMNGAVYTKAEFEKYYPSEAVVSTEIPEMGDLPTYSEALNLVNPSKELLKLISKQFQKSSAGSEALFLLQNELFRLGASNETAFVICKNSGLNKFERDGRTNADELLWADVIRARQKSEVKIIDKQAEGVVATVAPRKVHKSVDFLTKEEKDCLPLTFIDRYVEWAKSKTDAAVDYHIAAAFTVLSTIFSDFGHATPKFGRLPLNLWFMVLGDTTRSRKSTTRGQMLKMIHAVQDDDGEYAYDLGSDFTGEALANELLERANRSSLVHLDEVQSFLESLDTKRYLSGLKGQMTELYDGHVNGKLRATGATKKAQSANISLVLFMMGIRDEVANVLTEKDFQSGFLTRFIYVEADPPARTKQSDYLAQADPGEVKAGDPVFAQMVEDLKSARDHWESFNQPGAPTTGVPCVPEAWERLNQFISDVLDASEDSDRRAILEASAQRLSLSILKAATLLAMYEMCDEVELCHMLTAINYCSTWFTHLTNMAYKISESQWARHRDSIENFVIENGGMVEYSKAVRKFQSELNARQFFEIVNDLSDAERVEIQWELPEKKKGKRFLVICNG